MKNQLVDFKENFSSNDISLFLKDENEVLDK